MTDDDDLAERIRDALGARQWTSRKMFGGLGFMVDGHLAVAANPQGELMIRVDPDRAPAMLGPHVRVTVMGERTMPGWLDVDPEACRSTEQVHLWVAVALERVDALPPK